MAGECDSGTVWTADTQWQMRLKMIITENIGRSPLVSINLTEARLFWYTRFNYTVMLGSHSLNLSWLKARRKISSKLILVRKAYLLHGRGTLTSSSWNICRLCLACHRRELRSTAFSHPSSLEIEKEKFASAYKPTNRNLKVKQLWPFTF